MFQKYGNEIIVGRDGIKYLNNMLLSAERSRKLCGFSILTKSKGWYNDTCEKSNKDWLYPVTDQLDDILKTGDYKGYTSYFYNFYQSIYRAQRLCVKNETSAKE